MKIVVCDGCKKTINKDGITKIKFKKGNAFYGSSFTQRMDLCDVCANKALETIKKLSESKVEDMIPQPISMPDKKAS